MVFGWEWSITEPKQIIVPLDSESAGIRWMGNGNKTLRTLLTENGARAMLGDRYDAWDKNSPIDL